jgi:CheY-like chemotaxis protein
MLVAEDDASIRLTLDFLLSDEGFEIHEARDGEEAVAMAQQLVPDILLLDGVMPKMDGRQVLDALRSDEHTKRIPVVVLTGTDLRSWGEWSNVLMIEKPFESDRLLAAIWSLLDPPQQPS